MSAQSNTLSIGQFLALAALSRPNKSFPDGSIIRDCPNGSVFVIPKPSPSIADWQATYQTMCDGSRVPDLVAAHELRMSSQ
jgi:hypothetical protein